MLIPTVDLYDQPEQTMGISRDEVQRKNVCEGSWTEVIWRSLELQVVSVKVKAG